VKLLFISFILLPLGLWAQSGEWDESFDPTTLKDWPGAPQRAEVILSADSAKARGVKFQSIIRPTGYVYRVQLGSTADYQQALGLVEQARQDFKVPVLLEFESPYYKIRIGETDNREEADALQRQAVRKGYRNAWVVRLNRSAVNNH